MSGTLKTGRQPRRREEIEQVASLDVFRRKRHARGGNVTAPFMIHWIRPQIRLADSNGNAFRLFRGGDPLNCRRPDLARDQNDFYLVRAGGSSDLAPIQPAS